MSLAIQTKQNSLKEIENSLWSRGMSQELKVVNMRRQNVATTTKLQEIMHRGTAAQQSLANA